MENVNTQKMEQRSNNNLKKNLYCVVFKDCINANCLCECEGDICRQEPYEHCNIIKNEQSFEKRKINKKNN